MDLPPLSEDALSQLLASDPSPSELFEALAEYECQACLREDSLEPDLLSLFYSFHFFSHLLLDQICEARMLTKRMPQYLLERVPSLQNCLALLRAVWQRKHESVYKGLRELPWPDQLKPLIQRYDRHFQERTLVEVSKSYESIRPATAAVYLGLDPAAAEQGDPATIQNFTACGWSWNEQEKLLRPKPIITAQDKNADMSNQLNEVMALVGNSGR